MILLVAFSHIKSLKLVCVGFIRWSKDNSIVLGFVLQLNRLRFQTHSVQVIVTNIVSFISHSCDGITYKLQSALILKEP